MLTSQIPVGADCLYRPVTDDGLVIELNTLDHRNWAAIRQERQHLRIAVHFLKTKPACAKYVGQNTILAGEDPGADLNSMQKDMTYFHGDDFSVEEKDAAAGVRGGFTGRGGGWSKERIVLGYSFFNRAEAVKAGWGLGTAKLVQVMWMLHEYKHMSENRGHGREPWDSSVEWSRNVIKFCIK